MTKEKTTKVSEETKKKINALEREKHEEWKVIEELWKEDFEEYKEISDELTREKRAKFQRERRERIKQDPVKYKELREQEDKRMKEYLEKLKQDPVKWAEHVKKRKEQQKRYYEELKADPERWKEYKRKERLRYYKKKRTKGVTMKELKVIINMLLCKQDGYNLGVQDALKQILMFENIGREFLLPQLVASLDVIKNVIPGDPRKDNAPERYYEGYTDALIEAIEFLEEQE